MYVIITNFYMKVTPKKKGDIISSTNIKTDCNNIA